MLQHSHQNDLFTMQDLKALAEFRGTPCVSVFLPTFKFGQKRQENLIRFENALKTASGYLENLQTGKQLVESILAPARKTEDDHFFWRSPGDGLAMFAAPGFFEIWRIPYRFSESVTVNSGFSLKPLLPYLSDDGKFFLLCVDKNKVQLFDCSRYGMRQISEPDLPKSFNDLLPDKDFDRRIQSHGGPQRNQEQFHGQGGISDAQKYLLLRYFRRIDSVICLDLMSEKAPLIFAGAQNLFPIYRNANNYKYLVKTGIWGNPFNMNGEALHQEAWRIAQNHFSLPKKVAFSKVRDLKDTAMVSTIPEVVVTAASAGKVELLITSYELTLWGRFDPATGSYEEHPRQLAGDLDLLGEAALDTFLHRGSVYFVSHDEMPGRSLICAVLRQ